MASLLVVLVVLGCAAFQFLKGTVVRAFAAIIAAVCASIVAFGFFEVLAKLLAGYAPSLAPWAQLISFALLFILAFAVLQTAITQLTRHPVDLGYLPERIGRAFCGIVLGLFVSGVLLTAAAMAPLPNKYPYARFDARNPKPERPNKVLLNADGFATGWFSTVSSGSFSALRNKRSFAALHPGFLDQLYLNRHNISNGTSVVTSSLAIEVPKKAAWYAPDNITDSDGNPLTSRSGHSLVIARVGIKGSALKDAGKFTLSQLRLVCQPKNQAADPLVGEGRNAYPVGYMKSATQLQTKSLSDQITLQPGDFGSGERVKWIDFAFYVPNDQVCTLVQFKLNNVVQISPPVPAEQAPPAVAFSERAARGGAGGRPAPSSRPARRPASQDGSRTRPRRGISDISRSVIGDQLDEDQ
ncbi:MAG: CvpA family protein [Phycisphaerales bacterium]|nr:MAG: CvpA family protein [Phycisphaerales bacterium]